MKEKTASPNQQNRNQLVALSASNFIAFAHMLARSSTSRRHFPARQHTNAHVRPEPINISAANIRQLSNERFPSNRQSVPRHNFAGDATWPTNGKLEHSRQRNCHVPQWSTFPEKYSEFFVSSDRMLTFVLLLFPGCRKAGRFT